MPVWWRRVRRHFGISAPRMAVRTHLPWWGRGALLVVLLAIIGGMWWWGFDFGQIFGGFNRKEIEARLVILETEAAKLRTEASDLRARNTALESELAHDASGAQEALTRQATRAVGRERAAQGRARVPAEAGHPTRARRSACRSSGSRSSRTATTCGATACSSSAAAARRTNSTAMSWSRPRHRAVRTGTDRPPRIILLPEDEPGQRAALNLKFKYYQRVEGRFRVPPGTA